MRTVPGRYVASAVRATDALGVDPGPALAAAGIPPSLLDDARARFTPEQTARCIRALWRLSDDEMFGLGRAPVARGSFRMVALALITASDLESVCTRLCEFAPVLAGTPDLSMHRADGSVRLHADLAGIADPGHLVCDFLLVLLHRFLGWLLGRRLPLQHVDLPYPQPGDPVELDRMFGATLRFDADAPAITFAERLLALPVVRDQDDLERYLRDSPAEVLAGRDYGTTAADQVRRMIERGPTAPEAIAARLSISPQHLRRLMREQGTSVGAIRAEVHRDAAITALARGTAVADIARSLGFSEPSAFRRAFRRWTGSPPSAYRHREA